MIKLSTSNTIACASCHKQSLAFGDDAIASQGVNATTGRHSMRLVNNRFATEMKYFGTNAPQILKHKLQCLLKIMAKWVLVAQMATNLFRFNC